MTTDEKPKVGYGRPPVNRQFKKGQSGNPNGRPKKPKAPEIDAIEILDRPVDARINGERRQIDPYEAQLLQQLERARQGNRDAIFYLIDAFKKHGVIEPSEVAATESVVVLPGSMPWPMALIIAEKFGQPPWTKRQKAIGKELYLKECSDDERVIDEAIGYPDL